tara:strand:- start:74 stop:535 length:462 start_codon:yes stop_codon:yes gene_type:complete
MSNANDETPLSTERLTGRVKWFNNRAGFGFVTVLTGAKKTEDVFVHHSGIFVNDEQYKYLVQGEYISFELRDSDNKKHPYQAGNVRGVLDGMLMCETRNANRASRETNEDDQASRRSYNTNRRTHQHNNSRDESDQWTLSRQTPRESSKNATE